MSITIRSCRDQDEIKQYNAIGAYVFANNEGFDQEEVQTQPDWTTCGWDGDKLVATMGAFPFTGRLNGAPVPMAGVTMVGTLPGYRRQGILRRIMTRGFEEMRERNQPIAILWASMGAIYQRFGYGFAAPFIRYTFDPRYAQFQEPMQAPGTVQLHTPEDAYGIIKTLYIEWATPRNLALHRSRALWQANTFHPEKKGEPVYVGIYSDTAGQPRGHIVYQTRGSEGDGQKMKVTDFIALDLEAYRGLWDYILRHDLVHECVFEGVVGEDDPAPDLLLEPRILNKKVSDGIWLRVVDVEKALAARPYATRGDLAIGLTDAMCEWNSGTWLMETDGATTDVRQTDRTPDIVVTPNGLASLLAGYRTARHLARAGRISGSADGLASADGLFETLYAPHCPNEF